MTSKLYPTLRRAYKAGTIDEDFLTDAVNKGWILDTEKTEIINAN